MKRFIKTISLFLSIFLTVSMIVTFPAAAAAEHEVSGAAKIEANSSVGAILGAAAEQNKQSFALSEVVSNVTIEGKTAVVKLLHTKACMIVVGVYDESGNQLLQTAVRRGIHAEEETVTLDFESDLPAYFYLRAFILDNDCAPLGKPFESNRYTLAYTRFLEKTTADFPAENVVNFDDEADNNFAVFDSGVKKIQQAPVVSDGSYQFDHADEILRTLREGDIFTYDKNGEPEIVKVDSISVHGDTVVITPANAELDEVFDYVKIDVTADEAEADMSEADAGVSFANSENNVVGASADYTLLRHFTFELEQKAAGVEGELDLTASLHFRLYYDGDILETELTDRVEGELDIASGAFLETTVKLCKLRFPTPVAGLFVAITPAVELKASAAYHGKVNFSECSGFVYNTKAGFQNLSEKPQMDAEVDFEGKIYVGFQLTPSIEALFGVVELGCEIKIGAEGVGTRVLTTTDTAAADHLCRWCVDGTINGKVEIEAEVATGFLEQFKYTVSAKLLDYEKKLFDFYVSSDLGFGKGDCPNSQPVPEQPVTPYQRMDVTYEEREKADSYVLSADRLHIDVYVSGSGNVKSYNGFGLENYVEDYNDRVYEKAEALYPYDWDKRNKYIDDHKILYGFTYTYHISGFHAVSASLSGDVYISGPTKVVVLNNCHSFHVPDSVEELTVVHTEETSLHLPASVKYISGFNGCDFTELTIPSTTEYVDAFDNCPISKLTILPPKKSLTIKGFYNCRIESLTIPAGVRSISNFMPLKKAVVQTDAPHLLQFFKNLEEVTFDTPVIGRNCCDSCPALKKVNFTPSVTCIGEEALKQSGVQSVTIPGTVKKIDQNAFRECSGLREVVMQEGVKQIDRMAFADCPKLERVVLPSSVSFLCKDAFRECAQNIELDFCGEPWQWWNITAEHDHQKMIDVEYDASVFMNCTVFLNSDGSGQMKNKTGGASVGAQTMSGYPDTAYLLAVEDAENGRLGGAVKALVQVTADKNGMYFIPDEIHAGEGDFLNCYGTCRHPSGHLTEENQYRCDICGEHLPAVIVLDAQNDSIIGDVDGDGKITVSDVTAIQKHIAEVVELTDRELDSADTNGDGKVAIDDATYLQLYLAEYDVVLR